MQTSFSDTLFKTAPAVALLLDPDGKITAINPHLEQISGYIAKEVLGKYWFEVFTPNDDQPTNPEFLPEQSAKAAVTRASKAIITTNGMQRQIEWRGTTLSDGSGNILGYLNVGHDATERLGKGATDG